MQMQIRIKASDDFDDRLALAQSGGRYDEKPYPVFIFMNQAQRQEYDRIRREMKGANKDGTTTTKGDPEARTVSRKYRRSREFRV